MSDFLSSEKILLPEGHYPPLQQTLLEGKIKAAGGNIAASRDEATIVLLNPSAPSYQSELDFASTVHQSYPSLPQPKLYPYHWLLASCHASALLPLPSLQFKSPIFTHPDGSRFHAPLLAWVSINIHRHENEDPAQAQQNVQTLLESGGALIVSKRAQADLFIVDLNSKFAETVKAEKIKYGRTHQKIAERDWVEDCIRHGRLVWPREQKKNDDAEGESEDSMAGEDEATRRDRNGPGRPTGKPRVEYTPQDDDFLCRYLAAHHPAGSWQSRKTYQTLASKVELYPIADRHSAQSWHERFKKNAGPLSRRIERLEREGIDVTLKTRAERERARDAQESREAEARDDAAANQDEERRQETGMVDGSTAQHEGARATMAAMRALEGEAEPSRTVPDTVAVAQVAIVGTVEGEDLPPKSADKKHVLVESDGEEDPAVPPASKDVPPPNEDVEMEAAPAMSANGKAPDSLPGTTLEMVQIEVVVEKVQEAQETQNSNGDSLPREGAETQAILDDYARVREPAASSSLKSPERQAPSTVAGLSHQSPRFAIPNSEVKASAEILPSQASNDALNSAPEQIQESQAAKSSAQEAQPVVQVTQPVVEPPVPTRVADVEMSSPSAGQLAPHAASSSSGVPDLATPRHPRVSLFREEILSSSAKRRRVSDRRKSKSHRSASPDKVYVSTSIPPASRDPEPFGRSSSSRAPSPVLSDAERVDRIVRGRELVERRKEEYKVKIKEYGSRYGIGPMDVFKVVNEVVRRASGGGNVDWDEVERGFQEKYGH